MRRVFLPAVISGLLCAVISAEPLAMQVTVHELLAHPQNYDGKQVEVTGYYDLSTEESSLHANKRAHEHQNQSCDSSIWLEVSTPPARNAAKDQDLSFKTVRVIGTFHYQPEPILGPNVPYEWKFRGFGTYKMWAHEISDITYLQPVR